MSKKEAANRPVAPTKGMVLDALKQASQKALRIHKALGNPVSTVRDGKVVWISPEEIQVDPTDSNARAG